MTTQGSVGIFWWIDGMLLAAGCAIADAEVYGANLTYDGGHAEHWDRWRAAGPVWLKAHGMPVSICCTEYDAHPRGRIVKAPDKFVIYADRRIHKPERIAQIRAHFGLNDAIVQVRPDEHYQ